MNRDRYIPTRDENGEITFLPPKDLGDVFDIAMIRKRPDFVPLPAPAIWRKLVQLGGGRKRIDGWEDLDYPEWDAESMPLPYEDDSVDAIFSAHALDHMTATAVQDLLAEIQRVLKPEGTFTNVVPHHMSTLALECLEHKTRYGIKTWRNIFDNPAYTPINVSKPILFIDWRLRIGYNMVMGVEERNLVLVTQLIKEPEVMTEIAPDADGRRVWI